MHAERAPVSGIEPGPFLPIAMSDPFRAARILNAAVATCGEGGGVEEGRGWTLCTVVWTANPNNPIPSGIAAPLLLLLLSPILLEPQTEWDNADVQSERLILDPRIHRSPPAGGDINRIRTSARGRCCKTDIAIGKWNIKDAASGV
ncbi:unnamed protein product [Lampetra planeri]